MTREWEKGADDLQDVSVDAVHQRLNISRTGEGQRWLRVAKKSSHKEWNWPRMLPWSPNYFLPSRNASILLSATGFTICACLTVLHLVTDQPHLDSHFCFYQVQLTSATTFILCAEQHATQWCRLSTTTEYSLQLWNNICIEQLNAAWFSLKGDLCWRRHTLKVNNAHFFPLKNLPNVWAHIIHRKKLLDVNTADALIKGNRSLHWLNYLTFYWSKLLNLHLIGKFYNTSFLKYLYPFNLECTIIFESIKQCQFDHQCTVLAAFQFWYWSD